MTSDTSKSDTPWETLKEDLVALSSLFGTDSFSWDGSSGDCLQWENALHNDNPHAFSSLAPPTVSLVLDPGRQIELIGTYRNNSLIPQISIRSSNLSRVVQSDINKAANDYIGSLLSQDELCGILIQAVTFVQEKLEEISVENETELSSITDANDIGPGSQQECVLKRALLWSHHLLATSKRKSIFDWSHELHLWCISKPGYPGLIIVEGMDYDVDEFLQRIKRLTWKALQVRSEEKFIIQIKSTNYNAKSSAPNPRLHCLLQHAPLRNAVLYSSSSPLPTRPCAIETESMSDVSNRMEAANLKELFLTAAMKL